MAAFGGSAAAAALSLLHVLRPRRSVAHWTFAVGMALLSAEIALNGLTCMATDRGAIMGLQQGRLLVLSTIPGVWLLFSFCFARGGGFGRVRAWPRLAIAALFILPVLAAFLRTRLASSVGMDYAKQHWVVVLGGMGVVVQSAVLVVSILLLMNLERTYRAAAGTTRWRIKYTLLGTGVLFVTRIYTSCQALLFRGVDLNIDSINSAALLVGSALAARSIFRSRDFEVDVYPSQSVLQGSITVVVAGAYLLLTGILAKVAASVGGDNAFALKAFVALVAVVALAVLIQSDRARLYLRHFVSRNFNRPLYDYRTVWMKFTEASTSRVAQADLCRAQVKLIAEMFQALSVAIWVTAEKRESMTLEASTFLSEKAAQSLDLTHPPGSELASLLLESSEPFDIEGSAAAWAGVLRGLHPSQFPNGGHRVCVPLVSRGELIGAITVGDRVGGAVFSLQDFDMLRCVGAHVTAGLRNVQLSQKLLQAKELEAFQTMATFFVHDMKNAASTLNLMLQNLPEHFDDPAFREDSLRGIAKTAEHINILTGRLGALKSEPVLCPVPEDLNDVVSMGLQGLERGAGAQIARELSQVPRVMLDREQFSKVVTNLALNAKEAITGDGLVRVSTRKEGAWVLLVVADNGTGMTADFINRGLFKPFRTTKKNGLGIGMFQSKMIVEAHGGRISVASEPGEGTTFTVFLPIPHPAA